MPIPVKFTVGKVILYVLGITQAQLAERVDTSANYIALIESERKFPSLAMLERIAAALEIDAPALFSTKTYRQPMSGTLARLQEQLLSDISEDISFRFKKFEGEFSPAAGQEPGVRAKGGPGGPRPPGGGVAGAVPPHGGARKTREAGRERGGLAPLLFS
ncbi:MAG: helix-turn-helix domain-containing protein [Treponema sp.]|nr:helix-turn-helix domain-containing protein [Treponema sp.]